MVAVDFWFNTAMDAVGVVLRKFAEAAWGALLHFNTSPKPSLAKVVREVVRRGREHVGSFVIFDELWHEIVLAHFLEKARQYDVEADP